MAPKAKQAARLATAEQVDNSEQSGRYRRFRLRCKQSPPLAFGGSLVGIKSSLSGDLKLSLPLPSGISASEVTRRVAEALDADPEEISLKLSGGPLPEKLPSGEVVLELLRKGALAILTWSLFEAGVPSGSWLLVTYHDEVRVHIINLESNTTLAGIFYPTYKHFITDSGRQACRSDYEDMYVDDVEGQRWEAIEALHKYVRKVGDEGSLDLEWIDPLRAEDLGESLPQHFVWMGDQDNFPPGTRAFAEGGYRVTQLV